MPCLSDGTTTARSSSIGPAFLSRSCFRTSHPCGAWSPRRRRARQDCSPSVLVIAGRSSLSFFSWSRSGYSQRRPSLLTAFWSCPALRSRILRCCPTAGLPPRGSFLPPRGSLLPPRADRRFRLLVALLGVFLPRSAVYSRPARRSSRSPSGCSARTLRAFVRHAWRLGSVEYLVSAVPISILLGFFFADPALWRRWLVPIRVRRGVPL